MQATGSTARPGSAALRAVIATSAKKHQRDEDQREAEGGAEVRSWPQRSLGSPKLTDGYQ